MSLTIEKNMRELEEWCLLDVGRFVRFEVVNDSWANMVFEHETWTISGVYDDRSSGEMVAEVVSVKPTKESVEVTDLEVARFDMCTSGIWFTLTNGDEYGLTISSNFDEFDNELGIPDDLEEEFTLEFIYPTV